MPKIYRVIFRLDYPLSYQFLDSLGKVTDFVQTFFDNLPIQEKKVDLDILNRKIDAFCVDKNNNGLLFVVELQTIHGSFDFKNGAEIPQILKFFGVDLIHEMVNQLKLDSLKYFNRFGIRCLYLSDEPAFTFDSINRYILKQEKILSNAFEHSGFSRDDSLIKIVGKKELNGLGVAYGPYQVSESPKHFGIQPSVNEGLIIDIDLFTSKLEAQKIDFKSKMELYLSEIDKLAKSIVSNLEKEINV